jgi:rare lipoprotein A
MRNGSAIPLATRTLLFGSLVLVSALVSVGCAKKSVARNTPPPPPPSSSPSGQPAPGVVPTISDLYGYASWYGYPYHGRKTASGEVYDMYQLTAAHKTLPLGTVVRVSNQDNGREVEVRINDRGPFVDGRVIDLSYAAAKQIQMIGPGIALVKLSILDTINRMPPPVTPAASPQVVLASSVVPSAAPRPATRYGVQVGAFRQKENAVRLQEEILHRHTPVTVSQSGDLYKVFVGAEGSEAAAQSLAASLRKEHLTGTVVALP